MPVARIIGTIFITLTLTASYCQSTEQLISDIRTEFKRINTEAKLRTTELNNEEFLEQMTDGGGKLTGYFENDKLVKFTEWVGLSYGAVESEYYFKNGELFFVYQKESKYADKVGGQVGDLDYTKLETKFEGRYYLNNNEQIKEIEKGERLFSQEFEIGRAIECARTTTELLKNEN
jgi:hypothetical protein